MANDKLNWAKLDETSLPANLQKLVKDYRQASKAAGEAKETLRKALEKRFVETKRLDGATQTLKLTLKWGQLNVAKAEAEEPKAAAKPTLSW
jgi:CHASE3 domain sensor protein